VLVGGSCLLDLAQAVTTEFSFHYILIQLAGFTMCLTLLHILIVLWRLGRQMQRVQMACWTFAVLCVDLLLVAALHNRWVGQQSFSSVTWTALEYLGMVLYTAVMVQIGSLLPAATVKVGCLPRIISEEIATSKSLLPQHSHNGKKAKKVGT
ncbi:unnamed protein product, partial [Symbiodinium pilosum]